MTQQDPAEIVARIRGEVAEVSNHLVHLAADLQALSASLGSQPWADPQAPPLRTPPAPVAVPTLGGTPPVPFGPHVPGGTPYVPVGHQAPGGTPPAPGWTPHAPVGHQAPEGTPPPPFGPPAPGWTPPAPPAGPGLPPGWIQFPAAPAVTGPVGGPRPAPPTHTPATPAPGWGRPVPAPRPRRPLDLAEVFAIVGSVVTLIGVALVLMLPQDGFLGPLGRVAVGLGLAAATVAAAVWQHRSDEKNIGAQALLATGVASTFLVVIALTVVFKNPAGEPMVPLLPGLVLAGLVSVAGLLMARLWRSEWLAVLAILGSLLLAPWLGNDRVWIAAFMAVMTVGSGLLQRGLGWVTLVVARSLPTGVYFLWVAVTQGAGFDPGRAATHLPALVLATALALASLGLAVMHQTGPAGERVAAVAMMVLLTAPVIVTAYTAGRVPGTVACLVLAAAFTAAGALRDRVDPLVRAAAIPLGAAHLGYGVLLATDGRLQGLLFWGLALAYLGVAERSRSRPVLVVGGVLGVLGLLHWLPLLATLFNVGAVERFVPEGVERVVESILGVAVAIVAQRAVRPLLPARRSVLVHVTWAVAVVFGTVAVVLAGTLAGRATGDAAAGFQIAHAIVTVTWMGLCVLLLARGLRADADSRGSIPLATALAAAAVLKLFLFDLATLPGLARALAFLAVGVLLLVVGTWYHRQLSRVRRPPTPPGSQGWPPPPDDAGWP